MSVTWNGSDITRPVAVLIYHDEIRVDMGAVYSIGNNNEGGALICMSEAAQWHYPNSDPVDLASTSNTGIQQIKEQSRTRLSRSRQGLMLTDDNHNGLWTCRVDGSIPIPVGFYHRGGGKAKWVEAMRLRGKFQLSLKKIPSFSWKQRVMVASSWLLWVIWKWSSMQIFFG